MYGRIRGILRSAVDPIERMGRHLVGPFQETSEYISSVKKIHTFADREAINKIRSAGAFHADRLTSATEHSVYRGPTEIKLRNHDLRRFRFYDTDGDVSVVAYPSKGANGFSPFTEIWTNRKTAPLATNTVVIGDPKDHTGIQLPAPWAGQKPVFFVMHGLGGSDALVSYRRSLIERRIDPTAIRLRVEGTTAADILWETGSFQNAISKDASRPVVGVICEAAKPPTVFADAFSARLYERGFTAKIYLGREDVHLGVSRTPDGELITVPLFYATVRGQDPIAVFEPP